MNFVSSIDQPLVVQLANRPPDRLDILIFECDVGLIQIHPVPHTSREIIPQILVLENTLSTLCIVLSNSILLHLRTPLQPKCFLHLNLYRKPMRIPSALALHLVSLQTLVAAEQILHGTGHHVMNPRFPVGRRRPLVKGEWDSILPALQSFLKNVIFFPPGKNFHLCIGIR